MFKINSVKNLTYQLIQGSDDIEISSVCYDSRNISKDCVFVCLQGANFDSHSIIEEICSKGASTVVISHDCEYPSNVNVIRVDNSRISLGLLSAALFDYPSEKMTCIGVTGTKGKTTTTHMIKLILETAGFKVGMIGTNGIYIGQDRIPTINTTPESYDLQKACSEMVDKGCKYMIMEVSSQGIMLNRTAGIHYTIGAFTNISPDHIGPNEHKSFEEYLDYKTKLFDSCSIGIVNADDDHAQYVLKHAAAKEMFTIGRSQSNNYFMDNIRHVSQSDFVGVEFDLHRDNTTIDCRVGIPAIFNAYNGAMAIAVCELLNINKSVIGNALSHIHVDGRMEVAYSSDKFKVIVDYAHNAVSMESLLKSLREYKPKRLVVVFGCGGNRSKDRRYGMGDIGGRYADLSIITADNSRFEDVNDIMFDIESSIKKTDGKYIKIPDRREAIFYAIENAEQGDIIAVIGKGHEDYQEIAGVRHHFLDREVVDEAIESERTKNRL